MHNPPPDHETQRDFLMKLAEIDSEKLHSPSFCYDYDMAKFVQTVIALSDFRIRIDSLLIDHPWRWSGVVIRYHDDAYELYASHNYRTRHFAYPDPRGASAGCWPYSSVTFIEKAQRGKRVQEETK